MKTYVLKKWYSFLVGVINLLVFFKPRVLIYTDSRGFDVRKKGRKNPFKSYISYFLWNYRVDYFICPEKHTTITDFLLTYDQLKYKNYRFVILHCGVVDFSPRPESNLKWVLDSKRGNKYLDLAREKYPVHYTNLNDQYYMGEKTQNLYPTKFLIKNIIPELISIKDLIWISSNPFVKNWEGNYTKERPKNINEMVTKFENVLRNNLSNVIDLKNWSDKDVKHFTIDNIHFSEVGFKHISNLLEKFFKDKF